MTKNEFLQATLNMFYKYSECDLTEFKKMLEVVIPIFGELKTTIEEDEDGKKITFVDVDIVDSFVDSNGNEIKCESINMSTVALRITLDTNGVINTVDGGLSFITPANKDLHLYLASLIGKKINL